MILRPGWTTLMLAPSLLLAQVQLELPPEAISPAVEVDELLLDPTTPPPQATNTVIGGYGQFNVEFVKIGPDAPFDGTANLRRMVVFISHSFNETFRVYTELEWENALSCRTCVGSTEVEQSFIDARIRGERLSLRAGLVLMPVGIINQWHEPSVFHGVNRPRVEERVIPSTWRELGVGIVGHAAPSLYYEAYLVTAMDPTGIGPEGVAGGRTQGALAPAKGLGAVGRLEWEPKLGLTLGMSAYAADMGPNAEFYNAVGDRLDLFLPMYLWNLDVRMRHKGLEFRALWVEVYQPEADDLMEGLRADGSSYYPEGSGAVASRITGGYGEVSYDVLFPFGYSQQVLPFVRVERYNTQATMPEGYEADPAFDIVETTLGISYRPIPQVVAKGDVQWRDRRYGYDELQYNLGMGFMF